MRLVRLRAAGLVALPLALVVAGVLAFVLGALIFQLEEADEVWRALAARFRR